MDKLEMQTKDLANKNFEKLKALFPNAITETIDDEGNLVRAIDKDILLQEISTEVVEGREERYQFTWSDKRKAIVAANEPISKTLRPCREESVNFDETENLYIEGDNLEVLKLLQETYFGKIKMIYIDPPYNTGSDFVYNDNFSINRDEYLEDSGQYDEYGNRLEKNLESNGRFHTDWLNMMYPRLKLARNLLTEDGLIFISIDDNEQANLKKLCDEIFGEEAFVNCIAVKMSEASGVKMSHVDKKMPKLKEYILVYKKNKDSSINSIKISKGVWDKEYSTIMTNLQKTDFNYIDNIVQSENFSNDEFERLRKILEKADFISVTQYCKEQGIKNADEIENFKWENSFRIFQTTATSINFTKTIIDYIRDNNIKSKVFPYITPKNKIYIIKNPFDNSSKKPRLQILFAKDYLDVSPGDFWSHIKTTGLDNEGFIPFKNGKKPLKLINELIEIGTNVKDIILDFFSGFRVIIMTQANSQVNTRVLELLPKFKIKKMNRWCAV